MTSFLESLSNNIVVDRDKCIACGVCVERCILDNLRLLLPTCRQACPLDVNCQGYMKLIAAGKEEEASRHYSSAMSKLNHLIMQLQIKEAADRTRLAVRSTWSEAETEKPEQASSLLFDLAG